MSYCLACLFSFIPVLADRDLLKSVLECSELVTSLWKRGHPSDTEEDPAVGLSSEDEATGLEPAPGVARHMFGGPTPVGALAPTEVPPKVCPAEDEVLVKRRALKQVKQQVSALLHGEDLPKVAQAREVAEVPYQIPSVPREAKDCPGVPAVLQDPPPPYDPYGGPQGWEIPM